MKDVLVLGLQSEHVTFWWITLGMGAVVIVAVIVLLSLLVSFVDDIDQNVKDVWDTATRLAANTSTTWMLQQTAVRTEELGAEVRKHSDLLAAMGGGGRR
ncbi:MAG TPA: hypothetical protein VM264_07790 [Acidimicrobiales bacterium]|nr:hypothetical protein [Acidimicrobiales bacterium]